MSDQPRKHSSSSAHKSHRARSRSSTPSVHGKTSKSHRSSQLPAGIKPIHIDDDFFAKSLEFKFWLKNKKNKFIDQLDSAKTRKYFSKFVRHWNKGKLDADYYDPPAHWRASSSATSSHAWTFKGATTLDREKAKSVRREAIVGPSLPPSAHKPIIGPALPPSGSSSSNLAEYQNQQEEERDSLEQEQIRRKNELKRKRKEDREEEASNRATGKDRLLEKRKEKRDAQSAYQREREDPTSVELDDRNLFGTSNSFQAAIRARDRAQERKMGKNASFKQEKQLIMQEKMAAMKSKEDETMAMFKAMAASKFGASAS